MKLSAQLECRVADYLVNQHTLQYYAFREVQDMFQYIEDGQAGYSDGWLDTLVRLSHEVSTNRLLECVWRKAIETTLKPAWSELTEEQRDRARLLNLVP